MTHTQQDHQLPYAKRTFELISSEWAASEVIMEHNYGLLRVDPTQVMMEVRGAEGQLILGKSVRMDEMRFDPDILKYDAFCQIREQS